jgi:hypothetical protein
VSGADLGTSLSYFITNGFMNLNDVRTLVPLDMLMEKIINKMCLDSFCASELRHKPLELKMAEIIRTLNGVPSGSLVIIYIYIYIYILQH